MEEKKYLTEEQYESGKKKLITISILIVILGLSIGGSLITTGIIKSSKAKTSSNEVSISELQSQIDTLKGEMPALKAEWAKEAQDNGLSEEYYNLQQEITDKQKKINDLEMQINKSKLGIDSANEKIDEYKYTPLYIFGGFIIFASFIIAFPIYLIAKRREITAFTTQQVMPVAKEGIEEMSPTMGKASKEIAKGITQGIKEGLKNEDEE